uniref:uncharacterized protein n=1 Tax=Myxine glutinosa TaxID=7769 RepID=UPI00358E6D59
MAGFRLCAVLFALLITAMSAQQHKSSSRPERSDSSKGNVFRQLTNSAQDLLGIVLGEEAVRALLVGADGFKHLVVSYVDRALDMSTKVFNDFNEILGFERVSLDQASWKSPTGLITWLVLAFFAWKFFLFILSSSFSLAFSFLSPVFLMFRIALYCIAAIYIFTKGQQDPHHVVPVLLVAVAAYWLSGLKTNQSYGARWSGRLEQRVALLEDDLRCLEQRLTRVLVSQSEGESEN